MSARHAITSFVPLVLQLALRPLALAAQTTPDSAAIAALEYRVEAAVAQHDTAFLARIYAPDFRFTHSSGLVQDRAAILTLNTRALAAHAPPTRRELDSLQVEVHGDVALSTGRIHVSMPPGDRAPAGRDYSIRYARIWARRDGAWQLLTHHSTEYNDGPPVPTSTR